MFISIPLAFSPLPVIFCVVFLFYSPYTHTHTLLLKMCWHILGVPLNRCLLILFWSPKAWLQMELLTHLFLLRWFLFLTWVLILLCSIWFALSVGFLLLRMTLVSPTPTPIMTSYSQAEAREWMKRLVGFGKWPWEATGVSFVWKAKGSGSRLPTAILLEVVWAVHETVEYVANDPSS